MKKDGHFIRLLVIAVLFISLLSVLIWRMLDLMVLDRQFLKNQGDARSVRIIQVPAYRGMITDRNGVPLAVSTPVQSVWINPKIFAPSQEKLQVLSKTIHVPVKTLLAWLKHAKGREFLYVKRQIQPALVEKIQALHIPGVNFQQEYKRYYPQLESTAQLIGFTNIDDKGIEGIELAYQDWLMGEEGQKRVIKDRMGRIVEEISLIKPPRPGRNLTLSIDTRIQYLAYHALEKTCQKFEAKSGSVVVLDTQTGEVLALVNYPSFNPNARFRYTKDDYRNRAVVDLFEPGSVIKPFSIASALETGNFTPTTIIDTRPGWMSVGGHLIRDIHNYGILDVTGVLEHSSNVGVSKMVLVNPPEKLFNLLRRAGFGARTESGYPGESEGFLVDLKDLNPFVLATLSFGYGISVTALQLAEAYLIFANDGQRLPVSFIAEHPREHGERVLSQKTARNILMMMESVSEKGTGQSARVSGYRIAGKTGTARVAAKGGYEEHKHIASFIGIAPVSNPRLLVLAVVQEPTKAYYGSAVASPLFAEVMGGSLRFLSILPDK